MNCIFCKEDTINTIFSSFYIFNVRIFNAEYLYNSFELRDFLGEVCYTTRNCVSFLPQDSLHTILETTYILIHGLLE